MVVVVNDNIIKEVGGSLGYSHMKEEHCAVIMQLVDGTTATTLHHSQRHFNVTKT